MICMFFFIILLIVGCTLVKGGIDTMRSRRTFWFAPNVSGFKDRKGQKSSQFLASILGLTSLIFGIFLIFLGIKGVITNF